MVKNVVLEFWYGENKEMFYDSGIWNSTLNQNCFRDKIRAIVLIE